MMRLPCGFIKVWLRLLITAKLKKYYNTKTYVYTRMS